MTTETRPGPRQRLIDAARELTYVQGVNVGVDAILSAADVARRSLYQHFGSKEQLLAEVLRTTADRDLQRYATALDSGGTEPRARLLAMFDTVYRVTQRAGHGCRYTAAELGLPDPDHPARTEARAYKVRLRDLIEGELRDLGHPDPHRGAEALVLIIDGILVSNSRSGPRVAAVAARDLVEHVLAEAPRPGRSGRRPAQ